MAVDEISEEESEGIARVVWMCALVVMLNSLDGSMAVTGDCDNWSRVLQDVEVPVFVREKQEGLFADDGRDPRVRFDGRPVRFPFRDVLGL